MILNPDLEQADSQDIVEILASVATFWDLFQVCFANDSSINISKYSPTKEKFTPYDYRQMVLAAGFHVSNEFFEKIIEYYKGLRFKNETNSRKYLAPAVGLLAKYNAPALLTKLIPQDQQDSLSVLGTYENKTYGFDLSSLGNDAVNYFSNTAFARWLSDQYRYAKKAWYFKPVSVSVQTESTDLQKKILPVRFDSSSDDDYIPIEKTNTSLISPTE
jgi:hypothetical protein